MRLQHQTKGTNGSFGCELAMKNQYLALQHASADDEYVTVWDLLDQSQLREPDEMVGSATSR